MTQTFSILSLPRPARLSESLRARLRPLDIAAKEIGTILGEFGLELRGPTANLTASRRNHNVAVETSAGKKLLKCYRPQWQRETVSYGHAIIDRLAELSFPVPRLSVARDGQSFVCHAGRHYALFEFVDGTCYSGRFLLRVDRHRLMAMAGATMGRFHRTLLGFTPAGRHHLGFEGYSGARRRDLAWQIGRLHELVERSRRLARPADQPHADWLVRNAPMIAERLVMLEAGLADAPLTRTVIHGDYGLHNLLFQRDGTVTPVDFELARLEWRLSDLVSCLSRLRYSAGPYDFPSIQWFLQAYHAEYPLSDDERQLFPLVWRYYKLQGAVQYWGSYFETGGPARKLISARDAVEQAEWAALHHEHLREQLEARIDGRGRCRAAG